MEKKNVNEAVGEAFEELNIDEMESIQGAGNVEQELISISRIVPTLVISLPYHDK